MNYTTNYTLADFLGADVVNAERAAITADISRYQNNIAQEQEAERLRAQKRAERPARDAARRARQSARAAASMPQGKK